MNPPQYDPNSLLYPSPSHQEPLCSPKSPQGLSLDHLFEMIGIKWYHVRLLLTIGTVAVCEGSQIIIVTLCVTLTQTYWDFSDAIRSLLATLTFFGVVIGSATAGFFADRYGRKKPMLAAVICMNVFNLASAFSVDVVMFGILRTLVGISLGFFAPIGFTYVVENVPKEHRGKIVMLAAGCLFIGQIIACGIAFLTIESLSVGDWRALLLVSTIPFVGSLIACLLYLDESLRYLLVMGRFEQAFELIAKVLRVNKNPDFRELSEEHKEGLQAWEHHLEEEVTNQDIASVKALFHGDFKRLTIILWFGWFACFFIYYGVILFLPWTLARLEGTDSTSTDDDEEDLTRLILSVLVEALSVVIGTLTMLFTSISQKKSLMIFFILTGCSSLAILIPIRTNIFVLLATITKILINICTYYFYLLTLEVYPTKYRATGLGLGLAVGKLATVLVPFACFGVAEVLFYGPFGLFALFAFAAAFAVVKLPQEIEYQDLK